MTDRPNDHNYSKPRPKCEQWRKFITLLLDDELSGKNRDKLTDHLATCEACRAELTYRESLRGEWADAVALESSAEDRSAIVEAARSQLRETGPSSAKPSVWERLRLWTAADLVTGAAAVVIIVLAVQLGAALRSADPTSGWAKSSPAVYYQVEHEAGRDAGGEVPYAEPAQIPRPF